MSHHSQIYDEEMRSKMANGYKEMLSDLGATKQFPDGKLTMHDEGEIKFAVTSIDNKVIIEFGQPVHWLGMTGNQAIDLGRLLLKRGRKLTSG